MCHKNTYLTLIIFIFSSVSTANTSNTEEIQEISTSPLVQTPVIRISYPMDPITDHTGWEAYFSDLLELSLSKVDTPHILEAISMATRSQSRAERLIAKGIITLHWIHTSAQKEKSLMPIRIPLFKGLIGWRIFLVHRNKINLFKDVTTLEQLQKLSILQGIDWPDTVILKDNGFNVLTSRHTENLLRMLQHGRGDYFPRGITEAWGEMNSDSSKQLVVEKKFVLRYPTAFYFFVAKNNFKAKKLIEEGMNIAVSDGSFDKLFMKYFGNLIERSNLKSRKIFYLKNSLLPKETPLSRSELWFSIPTKTESIK